MIYLLKFSNGDTYVGSTHTLLGNEPPALRSAKQLYEITDKIELEECSASESNKRLLHWIEVLQPTIRWDVGTYSRPEITEVVNLFVTTDLTQKEISDITGVNYDTVKKILSGKQHKDATSHLDLDKIKKERKKKYTLYTLDNRYSYEVATLFEQEHNLAPGYLSKLKKNNYELPLEKYSFRPLDNELYAFKNTEGKKVIMTKVEAASFFSEMNISKPKIQRIFDGYVEKGWQLAQHIEKQNWFPN